MTVSSHAVAFLKPRRAKPFFLRHPWVFSGAVERIEGEPAQGDIVADGHPGVSGTGLGGECIAADRLFSREYSGNEHRKQHSPE